MDLNGGVNLPMKTLEEMCAVRITSQIVTTCKSEIATYDAIDSLLLPVLIKPKLRCWVRPMVKQYEFWCKRLQFDSYNISWTSYGVVDITKSIEGFLDDETVDLGLRNVVARLYCHEKYIFKLEGQLEDKNSFLEYFFPKRVLYLDHVMFAKSKICNTWAEIINLHNHAEHPDRHRLQELYGEGIKIAINLINDVALKYFLGKASQETLSSIFEVESRLDECFYLAGGYFSPVTIRLLFSKLDKVQKERFKDTLSCTLLYSLMTFPHQHLFDGSASSLVDNLCDTSYMTVIQKAFKDAEKHISHVTDSFVDVLWDVGAAHRSRFEDTYIVRWFTENIQRRRSRDLSVGYEPSEVHLWKCHDGCCCKAIPGSNHLFLTLEQFRKRPQDASKFRLKDFRNPQFEEIFSASCINDDYCRYYLAMYHALRTATIR